MGGCKFCGQTANIEVLQDWEGHEWDELATELCDCTEAKCYTYKKKRKEKAKQAIEEQFGAERENAVGEDIVSILKSIIDLAVEDRINSGTIDIGNGIRAKIGVNAKGFIKVERIKTEKSSKEA